MTVQIDFSGDMEAKLRSRAAASGEDVVSFVRRLVNDELEAELPDHREAASPDEFRNRLRALIAGHGVRRGAFDDSRESIYAGRGE